MNEFTKQYSLDNYDFDFLRKTYPNDSIELMAEKINSDLRMLKIKVLCEENLTTNTYENKTTV